MGWSILLIELGCAQNARCGIFPRNLRQFYQRAYQLMVDMLEHEEVSASRYLLQPTQP